MTKPRADYFIRYAFVVSALLVTAELITRYLITSPADSMPDPEIGWVYKPHTHILFTDEGWAVNETNAMGFNDRELGIAQEKMAVLVLGDSFTEALQVPQNSNFTSLVEDACPRLDVINAGRSGLSPIQYSILSKRFFDAALIHQAVVVLNATDMKDIASNKAEIVRNASGEIAGIKLKEKGLSRFRKVLDVIFSNSALANHLKNRIRAGLHENHNPETPDPSSAMDVAEEVETQEILDFVFSKISENVPLSVIYIPELKYLPNGEVQNDPKSAAFEKIISDVAKAHEIPFLSAQKFMEASYKVYHRPPVGFPNSNIMAGHLNEIGHQSVKSALLKLMKADCHSPLIVSNVSKKR